eukprot:COSAG04_NODE_20209_length_398_cov_0.869565_2_plen_78_part_01
MRAHRWIASPLGDDTNILWWAKSVKASMDAGGDARGFVDTSWVNDPAPHAFGDLKKMSECAWNLDSCIDSMQGRGRLK